MRSIASERSSRRGQPILSSMFMRGEARRHELDGHRSVARGWFCVQLVDDRDVHVAAQNYDVLHVVLAEVVQQGRALDWVAVPLIGIWSRAVFTDELQRVERGTDRFGELLDPRMAHHRCVSEQAPVAPSSCRAHAGASRAARSRAACALGHTSRAVRWARRVDCACRSGRSRPDLRVGRCGTRGRGRVGQASGTAATPIAPGSLRPCDRQRVPARVGATTSRRATFRRRTRGRRVWR